MKHKLEEIIYDDADDEISINTISKIADINNKDNIIINGENINSKCLEYVDIRRKTLPINKKEPRLFLYNQKQPDPKLCSNYLSDMYDILFETESNHLNNCFIYDEHFESSRNAMIVNIITLSSHPTINKLFSNHSLWLAISILDRYLPLIYKSNSIISKSKAIDISTTCLKLAVKLIQPLIFFNSNRKIIGNDLISMETDIMIKLDFDLYAITMYDFLIYYFELIHASQLVRILANYYAECSLFLFDLYRTTKPSVLAASILYNTLLQQNTFSDINYSTMISNDNAIDSNINHAKFSTPNNNNDNKSILTSNELNPYGINNDINDNNNFDNINKNSDNNDNSNIFDIEFQTILDPNDSIIPATESFSVYYETQAYIHYNDDITISMKEILDDRNKINKITKFKKSNIKLWELNLWLDIDDHINDELLNKNIVNSKLLIININDIINISKLLIFKMKETNSNINSNNISSSTLKDQPLVAYDFKYSRNIILQAVNSKYCLEYLYRVAYLNLPL